MAWARRATFIVLNVRAVVRALGRLWSDFSTASKVGIPLGSFSAVAGIVASVVT